MNRILFIALFGLCSCAGAPSVPPTDLKDWENSDAALEEKMSPGGWEYLRTPLHPTNDYDGGGL